MINGKHGQGTHSTKMGADKLAENTPNAPKCFGPICLPKPKSLGFLKKNSLWVSVVRDNMVFSQNLWKFYSLNCKKIIKPRVCTLYHRFLFTESVLKVVFCQSVSFFYLDFSMIHTNLHRLYKKKLSGTIFYRNL